VLVLARHERQTGHSPLPCSRPTDRIVVDALCPLARGRMTSRGCYCPGRSHRSRRSSQRLPRGLRRPDGSGASTCREVTWVPGALPAAVAVQSSLVPAPQGASRTMFSPSATAASNERPVLWRPRVERSRSPPAGSPLSGQPRHRGVSLPGGRAEGPGPRCQTQGECCEPYSSRWPCPA